MRILLAVFAALFLLGGARADDYTDKLQRGIGEILGGAEDLAKDYLPIATYCGTPLAAEPEAPQLCGLLRRTVTSGGRVPIDVIGNELTRLANGGGALNIEQAAAMELSAWFELLGIALEASDGGHQMTVAMVARLKRCVDGDRSSCRLTQPMTIVLQDSLRFLDAQVPKKRKLWRRLQKTYGVD